jgi:hypothetical protein
MKKKDEPLMKLRRFEDPHSKKRSFMTTPLPQASRHRHRDRVEIGKTLLEKKPSPPPERHPTKPSP